MKFDSLFARRESLVARRSREEQKFMGGSMRVGLPALPDPDDAVAPLSTPLSSHSPRNAGKTDPRRMSPRQLADWAHEMYLCRMLAWEEYCMAGFPPELHPQYNRTVGALTGKLAQPDAPRNMIRVWEEKLSFMLRYYDADEPDVLRVEKLLRLLRQQV